MQDKIYKFIKLDGNELDEKKIHTLSDVSVWIANVDSLNDSEEFKKFIINNDNNPYFDDQAWTALINDLRKEFGTCSFSFCNYRSKHMWEKYGGDGNGFLMELSVVNASCIHPINYQDRSVVVNGVLDDIKRNLRVGYDNQIYSCDQHYRESIKALMQLLYTKETKWKIEKECRVVIPLDNKLNGKRRLFCKVRMQAS